MCSLAVTLASKSKQFISVPDCTDVGNLVKYPQAVYKISY